MKIITFKPPLSKVPIRDAKPQKPGECLDFENLITMRPKDPAKGAPKPLGSVDKISTENRLASQGATIEDVGLAGSLLNALVGQIKASQPGALENVHNLEGILYYYQL
ncbi:MAG: hypothetical protein LBF58_12910 [Deltaproteobacteria bacterium]|jgi:hypothetical protein|nr:hypothetical protein [Deltaproteobacteria bacterium]